jgi:hypothetical protein
MTPLEAERLTQILSPNPSMPFVKTSHSARQAHLQPKFSLTIANGVGNLCRDALLEGRNAANRISPVKSVPNTVTIGYRTPTVTGIAADLGRNHK